jgi:hypothetical protein
MQFRAIFENSPIVGLLIGAAVLALPGQVAFAEEGIFASVKELRAPVAQGAREPSLSTMYDGRVLMSWTEPKGSGFAVKTAISDGLGWSVPQTIVEADDLFVNWADFPSAIALVDGTLVAHWLRANGDDDYFYDINIAFSQDEGVTWSAPIIPHDDRSQRQHGFATLLPNDGGGFSVIWLDGQSYDTYASQDIADNAMQLRMRKFSAEGTMGEDTLLDASTCTCCQTSAVVTGDSELLVVYRDRSLDEIRDISIVRETSQGWSTPQPVGVDGWNIEGCPVNGPAIDATKGNSAVAWFTAANDIPKVKVAFSGDNGKTFAKALEINNSAPSGRVDVIQLKDGSALVTWVKQKEKGEAILICAVNPQEGCLRPEVVAISPNGRTVGFPRMTLGKEGVFIAWTEPTTPTATQPRGGTTIRTVLARAEELK